jgi:hypothetical protein
MEQGGGDGWLPGQVAPSGAASSAAGEEDDLPHAGSALPGSHERAHEHDASATTGASRKRARSEAGEAEWGGDSERGGGSGSGGSRGGPSPEARLQSFFPASPPSLTAVTVRCVAAGGVYACISTPPPVHVVDVDDNDLEDSDSVIFVEPVEGGSGAVPPRIQLPAVDPASALRADDAAGSVSSGPPSSGSAGVQRSALALPAAHMPSASSASSASSLAVESASMAAPSASESRVAAPGGLDRAALEGAGRGAVDGAVARLDGASRHAGEIPAHEGGGVNREAAGARAGPAAASVPLPPHPHSERARLPEPARYVAPPVADATAAPVLSSSSSSSSSFSSSSSSAAAAAAVAMAAAAAAPAPAPAPALGGAPASSVGRHSQHPPHMHASASGSGAAAAVVGSAVGLTTEISSGERFLIDFARNSSEGVRDALMELVMQRDAARSALRAREQQAAAAADATRRAAEAAKLAAEAEAKRAADLRVQYPAGGRPPRALPRTLLITDVDCYFHSQLNPDHVEAPERVFALWIMLRDAFSVDCVGAAADTARGDLAMSAGGLHWISSVKPVCIEALLAAHSVEVPPFPCSYSPFGRPPFR